MRRNWSVNQRWIGRRPDSRVQPGSDADLVVYDPSYRGKISAQTHQMNLDYNSFEGFKIKGRPYLVTLRGKVAAREGNSSAILATESFSRASRIISRFSAGRKKRAAFAKSGRAPTRRLTQAYRMKTNISPMTKPSPETGSESI